jgi:TatD DNase family protein
MTSENKRSAMQFIDIGINFTNKAFSRNLKSTIEAAVEKGVIAMVVTGTDLRHSEQALELATRYPDHLYATAGIHPHDAKTWNEDTARATKALAQESKIVAIGETGLDFNRDFSPRSLQEIVFEKHIELACELKLPLFLHERDAFRRQHEILAHHRDHFTQAVVHCFTGTQKELFAYLDMDLHIGVTGWVCDERRGTGLAGIIHNIPDNRLMIETDGPYLLPRDLSPKPKSRRNEPMYLPHIAAKIAQCRGQTLEEVANATTGTARAFFSIP